MIRLKEKKTMPLKLHKTNQYKKKIPREGTRIIEPLNGTLGNAIQ